MPENCNKTFEKREILKAVAHTHTKKGANLPFSFQFTSFSTTSQIFNLLFLISSHLILFDQFSICWTTAATVESQGTKETMGSDQATSRKLCMKILPLTILPLWLPFALYSPFSTTSKYLAFEPKTFPQPCIHWMRYIALLLLPCIEIKCVLHLQSKLSHPIGKRTLLI